MNIDNNTLISYIFKVIIFLFAGSIHEFSHAFSAFALGDNTAKAGHRLTINPLYHIDLIGSIVFPFFSLLSGSFFIGWMKPIPINSGNFLNPDKGNAITSFAGPFSNFLQSVLGLILIKLLFISGINNFVSGNILLKINELLRFYVVINAVLMIFNLLPFPPLDGGWILRYFLPAILKEKFDSFFRYGFLILGIIIISGFLKYIFHPFYRFLSYIFSNIYEINIFYLILIFFGSFLVFIIIIKKQFTRATVISDIKDNSEKPFIKNEETESDINALVLLQINDLIYKYENDIVLNDIEKCLLNEIKKYPDDLTAMCKEIDFKPADLYCIECNMYKNCTARRIKNYTKKL